MMIQRLFCPYLFRKVIFFWVASVTAIRRQKYETCVSLKIELFVCREFEKGLKLQDLCFEFVGEFVLFHSRLSGLYETCFYIRTDSTGTG